MREDHPYFLYIEPSLFLRGLKVTMHCVFHCGFGTTVELWKPMCFWDNIKLVKGILAMLD